MSCLRIALLAVVLSAGCDNAGYILVTVHSEYVGMVTSFAVDVSAASSTDGQINIAPEGGVTLSPDRDYTFAIKLDSARTGNVTVDVKAISGDVQLARGIGGVTCTGGSTVPLTINLGPCVRDVDCDVTNGTPTCMQGACSIAACNQGWADCDGNYMNGCETNTDDVANCGGCNKPCSVGNGTPTCTHGACSIAACNPGWADCDGDHVNGCETNTNSDERRCGGCNKPCPTGSACINAACTTCPSFTGVHSIAGYVKKYGFCWYLGSKGASCDQVCADVGGINLANYAVDSFADSCGLPTINDVSTYFYLNNNACPWLGYVGGSKHTLGHGISGGLYAGKCASGAGSVGTFPGDTNDQTNRCVVCPCF